MTRSRWLTYAQLLRIPNVFTAFADIAMAGCATGAILQQPIPWLLLLLTSGCLYCSGMVWNDIFDQKEDAIARAFRPIPSGRVSTRTATILATVLMLIGLAMAFLASRNVMSVGHLSPVELAFILSVAIILYDAWLKRTWLGPVAMGCCRFLNVLMGVSLITEMSTEVRLHLASIVGVYIVGVTWFARTEEGTSRRVWLSAASIVMLLAMILAVTLPVHFQAGFSPIYYPYLVVAFAFFVGLKLIAAIRSPGPKEVQTAVKRCILGLILLDAVLASTFVGVWAGLIVLLLLPARWLGKWVYST